MGTRYFSAVKGTIEIGNGSNGLIFLQECFPSPVVLHGPIKNPHPNHDQNKDDKGDNLPHKTSSSSLKSFIRSSFHQSSKLPPLFSNQKILYPVHLTSFSADPCLKRCRAIMKGLFPILIKRTASTAKKERTEIYFAHFLSGLSPKETFTLFSPLGTWR